MVYAHKYNDCQCILILMPNKLFDAEQVYKLAEEVQFSSLNTLPLSLKKYGFGGLFNINWRLSTFFLSQPKICPNWPLSIIIITIQEKE